MKSKPDISGFRDQKISQFIEGGAADKAESPVEIEPKNQLKSTEPEDRIQKIFRFPRELTYKLKEAALFESKSTRRRVTENEIVERAVQAVVASILKS